MTKRGVSKSWEITINNFTDDDVNLLKSWDNDVNAITIAEEVGEQGTPHLQGRITFKRAYRLTALKKLHPQAHWEVTKAKQDTLYMRKKDSKIIIDKSCGQGKRSDLSAIADDIKAGYSLKRIAEEHPTAMMKYSRGIETVHSYINAGKGYTPPDLRGMWIYGVPGCGKTSSVLKHYGRENVYDKSTKGDWFCGYNDESVILLDDYDKKSTCQWSLLKRWLDRYNVTGEKKGGTIQLKHDVFVITSNYTPEELFADDPAMVQAIVRRCIVHNMNESSEITWREIRNPQCRQDEESTVPPR